MNFDIFTFCTCWKNSEAVGILLPYLHLHKANLAHKSKQLSKSTLCSVFFIFGTPKDFIEIIKGKRIFKKTRNAS